MHECSGTYSTLYVEGQRVYSVGHKVLVRGQTVLLCSSGEGGGAS